MLAERISSKLIRARNLHTRNRESRLDESQARSPPSVRRRSGSPRGRLCYHIGILGSVA